MCSIDIDATSIVPNDVVLSLHEHPLVLIDIQRRKDSVALVGLGKSFVCAKCKQIRHRFLRFCECCNVRVCQPCFQEAFEDQTSLIQETIRSQLAAEEERNRLFAGKVRHSPSNEGLPPIMVACIEGDFEAVKEIVEKNEFSGTLDLENSCEVGEHRGKTVIILASEYGHREMVMLLLGRGARGGACDNRGMTPLMHAAYGGHIEVLDELLFAGVDVDQTALCGYTALLFAANRGHTLCVQRLIAAGASLSRRTPKGRTPLIVAALNGQLSTVELILKYCKHTTDVTTTDFEGYSALGAAVARGHTAVEKLLKRWKGSG